MICTKPDTREMRFAELKNMILDRNYRIGMIESAIRRARSIPRSESLKCVVKPNTSRRPVCVVSWDPGLPSFSAIQQKHWRTMTTTDSYLKEVFPEPPLTAFKRQKNIKDFLIRAKIPPNKFSRPKRHMFGMRKCGKQCTACPFIRECKEVKSKENFKWKINNYVTCDTYNIIYLIQCNKESCMLQYIGESGRSLKLRLADHRGYINNEHMNQPTGAHFNLPGHSISNMNISIIEKVKMKDSAYRKEREKYLNIRNSIHFTMV